MPATGANLAPHGEEFSGQESRAGVVRAASAFELLLKGLGIVFLSTPFLEALDFQAERVSHTVATGARPLSLVLMHDVDAESPCVDHILSLTPL
jgi:hypothetical protein